MTATAVVFIVIGVAFLVTGALGLLRLPDFYLRAHAVAKSETVGIFFVVIGLIVHGRFGPGTVQMLFIMALVLVTTPTAVHAVADAAWHTSRPDNDVADDDGDGNTGDGEGTPPSPSGDAR
jgi:multicomponent Na+:H+ antiporter subunit G